MRNYAENIGMYLPCAKFQSLMGLTANTCDCGSKLHSKPPDHHLTRPKKPNNAPLESDEVEQLEELANCTKWFQWMSLTTSHVSQLSPRAALNKRDVVKVVKDVEEEAARANVASCDLFTDAGDEATFIVNGARKTLLVHDSNSKTALPRHVLSATDDVCVRHVADPLVACDQKLKKAYFTYAASCDKSPMTFESWVHVCSGQ